MTNMDLIAISNHKSSNFKIVKFKNITKSQLLPNVKQKRDQNQN